MRGSETAHEEKQRQKLRRKERVRRKEAGERERDRGQGLSRKAMGVRERETCLAGRKGSGGGNGRRETGEESKATAR